MNTLRSVSHLQRVLGDDLFNALISSDNTERVRAFAKQLAHLANDVIPTKEMTVGGRTYEILSFMRRNERSLSGRTMVERAVDMDANLGEDDGRHLLEHQAEIPVELQSEASFVFTDWRDPSNSKRVYCAYWSGGHWARSWDLLDRNWISHYRILRRK